MKKILLVYPRIPDTYWSFSYTLSLTGFKALMPPLGLLTVAALIPEDYHLTLVDMNAELLADKDILQADMIMISAMIVQKESFHEVVERCNKLGVPVAAGGPYPTSCHQEIAGVDYFILNEGEITIPPFFKDLKNGGPRHLYTSDARPDITQTPPPRYDLVNLKYYSTMALQASRGCPFSCEFCDIIELYGRVPRYKTPDQFIREMEVIYNLGFRGPLFIVDDNFIGNKRHVTALLRAVSAWQEKHNHPFTFFTEASINLAQEEEMLDLMVRARFTMVFIGIETPSHDSLLAINKNQNTKQSMPDAISHIQSKNIEVLGGFIVGFDSDTEDIFPAQIDFIQKAGIPVAMMGMLMALPGTQLWKRLKQEGRMRETSSGNNTHDEKLNFEPLMNEDLLQEGYRHVLSTLYTPANYFARCKVLLEHLPENPGSSSLTTMWEIKAFLRSLVRFAISTFRKDFYSFLLWALIHKPRHFARAANVAIKGYHFFMITDKLVQTHDFKDFMTKSTSSLKKWINDVPADELTYSRALKIRANTIRKLARERYWKLARSIRWSMTKQYISFQREIRQITSQNPG